MDLKITKRISYFAHWLLNPVLLLVIFSVNFSCKRSHNVEEVIGSESKPETVIKRRSDGTVSSVNQVNAYYRVHGIRATYYEDGKRHGPTRVYYKNGKLSAEFESERGNVLPGLKEYNEDGTLVASYPDVKFRELDFLASKNRLNLEIYCTKKRSGVKFFILHEKDGETSRVYLITEHDSALLQYYVQPGQELNKKVDILAEIPTELGNVLARKYSYKLSIKRL